MTTRAMIFIDNSWLYLQKSAMQEEFGESSYTLDYEKFPNFIRKRLAARVNDKVDIVRPQIFGSIPSKVHPNDEEIVENMQSFYDRMKELGFEARIQTVSHYNYENPSCPHRLRFEDRIAEGDLKWRPKEKCVDSDLDSSMVYYAAVNAYDVAVLVGGDRDFAPPIKRVRQLGKRVQMVVWNGSTAGVYMHPKDPEGIRDFEPVSLNDHLAELQRKDEKTRRTCNRCGNKFWTTWRGNLAYCDRCREEYNRGRAGPGKGTNPRSQTNTSSENE